MALTDQELRERAAQRREGIEKLRAQASALRASAESLRAQLQQGLPGAGQVWVRLGFDADGVLASIEADEHARAGATEDELREQLTLAFATAPVPQAVVRRLIGDPAALRGLREQAGHASKDEFTSDRHRLTLATVLGRPVELTAPAGALLSTPWHELEEEIVRLARTAAAEQEGAADE